MLPDPDVVVGFTDCNGWLCCVLCSRLRVWRVVSWLALQPIQFWLRERIQIRCISHTFEWLAGGL